MSPARTLSVFGGGIGDFILACPALAQLAKESLLDLLGEFDRLTLAVASGIARRAFSLDRVGFHTAYAEPSPTLRAFLANYDRCIVWLGHDARLEETIRRCGPMRVESHPGKPPPEWTRHASEYYADRLGVRIGETFRIDIPPARSAWDLIIHPGSGSVSKNWPIERFRELAISLTAHGLRVAWCLGPAEEDHAMREAIGQVAAVLPASSLIELAQILAGTRAYLGNDSGITHLAAAVGCRTVAIFGPTSPAVWRPRGNHVHCVPGNPWPNIELVEAAVLEILDPIPLQPQCPQQ